jgi:hypothetical protein
VHDMMFSPKGNIVRIRLFLREYRLKCHV